MNLFQKKVNMPYLVLILKDVVFHQKFLNLIYFVCYRAGKYMYVIVIGYRRYIVRFCLHIYLSIYMSHW